MYAFLIVHYLTKANTYTIHRRRGPQDDELLNGDRKQESDGRFGRYGDVEKAFRDAVLLRCLRKRLDNKRRYGYVRSSK